MKGALAILMLLLAYIFLWPSGTSIWNGMNGGTAINLGSGKNNYSGKYAYMGEWPASHGDHSKINLEGTHWDESLWYPEIPGVIRGVNYQVQKIGSDGYEIKVNAILEKFIFKNYFVTAQVVYADKKTWVQQLEVPLNFFVNSDKLKIQFSCAFTLTPPKGAVINNATSVYFCWTVRDPELKIFSYGGEQSKKIRPNDWSLW